MEAAILYFSNTPRAKAIYVEDPSGKDSVFYTDDLRAQLETYDELVDLSSGQKDLIIDILIRDHQATQIEQAASDSLLDNPFIGGCAVKILLILGLFALLGLVKLIERFTTN